MGEGDGCGAGDWCGWLNKVGGWVQVGEKDTTDLEFVVFERASAATLTGTVEGPDLAKWQPHITVQVTPKEGDGKAFSVPLPMSAFFEVRGVGAGEYWVAAKLGGSAEFESAPVGVTVGKGGGQHVGALTFAARELSKKEVRGWEMGCG